MSLHRRRFLEDSLLATAAALAAGPMTGAFGREDKPSRSTAEKLSVACVGVRGRGASHYGFFAGRPDTEVTYICDVDEKVANTAANNVASKQGRRPAILKDMRKVFEDASVDIVAFATPNHWHALGAIWAIQAGKDVYVEKPVSHNVSEGRRIVEAARKYKAICQAGTQSRSNPGMREAIEYLHSGKLGEVKLARALCYKRRPKIGDKGQFKPPAEVDYDLWSGPAPILPITRPQFHYDWHWQWAYGNGDLGNQGIHQMDIARWGLGVSDIGQSASKLRRSLRLRRRRRNGQHADLYPRLWRQEACLRGPRAGNRAAGRGAGGRDLLRQRGLPREPQLHRRHRLR